MKLIGAAQAGLPVKLDIVSSGVEVPLPKFHRSNEVGQPTQLPPPPSAKSHNKTSRQSSLKDLETSPQHQPFSQAAPNYSFVPPPPRGSRDSSPDGQTSDKTWTRFHQPGERQLNWSHFEEHRQLLGNEEDSSDRHSSDEEHDIWSIADDQRDYYTNQFQAMQPDLRGKITGQLIITLPVFVRATLVLTCGLLFVFFDDEKRTSAEEPDPGTAISLPLSPRHLPRVRPSACGPLVAGWAVSVGSNSLARAALLSMMTDSAKQSRHRAAITHRGNQSLDLLNTTDTDNSHLTSLPTSPSFLGAQKREWRLFSFIFFTSFVGTEIRVTNVYKKLGSMLWNLTPMSCSLIIVSPDKHRFHGPTPKNTESAGENKPLRSTLKFGRTPKTWNPNYGLRCSETKRGPTFVPFARASLRSRAHEGARVGHRLSRGSVGSSFSGAVAGAPTLAGSQGQLSLPQGPKKEPPPPPPPRPKRNHARSSSLDLNRLGKSNPQNLGAPPAVPPRVSPGNVSKSITGDVPSGMDFADFDHFAESRSDVTAGPPSQHQFQPGAFEVYKKPTSAEELAASPFLSESSYSDDEESSPAPTDDSAMLLVDQTDGSAEKKKHRTAPLAMAATEMKTIPNEKWELHQAVRAHRERNNMLVLLNSELNQELMEATEERLSLEIQLENLKPFSC
ncbi:unnamed protein product [Ixodes persulcatus]